MKKIIALLMVLVVACGMFTGCTTTSSNGSYPKGSVEIVVPFAAGGGMDLLARAIQPYLAEKGIQTVVTNMPGGGTSIASMEVYNSNKDGYKFLCSGIETIMAFNLGGALETSIDEWDSLGCLVYDAHVIIVPKNSPFNSIEELVTYAKENPGKLNWAGTSAKGNGEMSAHEFWSAAGVEMNYVPYESAADTRVAVMGNHADVGMVFVSEAKAILESGDVKGLAVFTAERSKMFPDIPTLQEYGYDINNGLHRGFFVPKGVPADVQKILADALKFAFDNEDFQKTIIESCGFEAVYLSPEDCATTATERYPVYQKLYEIMMGN